MAEESAFRTFPSEKKQLGEGTRHTSGREVTMNKQRRVWSLVMLTLGLVLWVGNAFGASEDALKACEQACITQVKAEFADACIAPSAFRNCLQSNADCRDVPQASKDVAGDACDLCARTCDAPKAPTPSGSATKPPASKSLTDAQRCARDRGGWVRPSVGSPFCLTFQGIQDRLEALERLAKERGPLSPLTDDEIRQIRELLAMDRTTGAPAENPSLLARLVVVERSLLFLCGPIDGQSLEDACEKLRRRIDETDERSKQNKERLNVLEPKVKKNTEDIEALKAVPSGASDGGISSLFAITATGIVYPSSTLEYDETPAIGGIEFRYMPRLVPNLRLYLGGLAGVSTSVATENRMAFRLTGGLLWHVASNVLFGPAVSGEWALLNSERSAFTSYSIGPSLFFVPGLSRKTLKGVVPFIGAELGLGMSRQQRQSGEVEAYFQAPISLSIGFAF